MPARTAVECRRDDVTPLNTADVSEPVRWLSSLQELIHDHQTMK